MQGPWCDPWSGPHKLQPKSSHVATKDPSCCNEDWRSKILCAALRPPVAKQIKIDIKKKQGFPGGPVVKNPSCSVGDTSLIPGQGRPHTPQGDWASVPQLRSPCATTTKKPVRPRACAPLQEKPPQWEATLAMQLESSPHLPQLEKAWAHQWRPRTAQNK